MFLHSAKSKGALPLYIITDFQYYKIASSWGILLNAFWALLTMLKSQQPDKPRQCLKDENSEILHASRKTNKLGLQML